MRGAGIHGAVIGGVAVVLHGHLRSTKDVGLLLEPPLEPMGEVLAANGFAFQPGQREFVKSGVPIHLVPSDLAGPLPDETIEIDGVTTVTLADLIGIKLKSGSNNVLRAQDLADVIGLIRHHRLTGKFTRHVPEAVRPEFRKLTRAIQRENSGT